MKPPGGIGRRLLFSLIPLSVLGAGLELGLRAAGYQGEPDRIVSWCREHAIPEPPFFPALQLQTDTGRWPYRAPRTESQPHPWSPDKPDGVRRVFALGGSAVHGYGFTRPGAWPDQLEGLLSGEGRSVEVINAGSIAWSSQQLLALAREIVAEHEPDALILYSGNNELLEWFDARRYLPPRELSAWVRALTWGRRLRASRVYRLGIGALSGVEVGHWGQTEYTDDEALPWPTRARMGDADRAFAEASYRYNVGRILEIADAAGVPVILSTVAANYDDAPGEFDFGAAEPPEARERLQAAEGALDGGGLAAAEALFEQSFDLWPEAIIHHRWAQILRRRGHPEAALVHYREAIRLDENPHRVPPYLNDAIREMGLRADGFVDGEAVVAGLVGDGILDWEVIYDYCHPTPDAHGALAAAFADALIAIWGGEAASPPAPPEGHVDGWLGQGVDPETGTYTRDPGSERQDWWREARAAAEGAERASAWNHLGIVTWHSFHGDCERGRSPCLQESYDAFSQAIALDEELCAAWANRGRLRATVGDPGAAADLRRAAACDPEDERSQWYLRRYGFF